MCRFRVAVRGSFVGYVYAPNYSKAIDMAKKEFGRISGLEKI
jgi:hypothetical protein